MFVLGLCLLMTIIHVQGESISDDEHCKVGCTYRKKHSGNMGFTCAILDCPELLGLSSTPGCHFKYNLDKCCNVGEVWEPFDILCKVDGETYHEGQYFSPPNTKCTKCVCKSGFEGKYETPFCKKEYCIEEVDHQKEIKNFCAPSYISKDDCCPFSWICPEDSDTIVVAKTPSKHPGMYKQVLLKFT
ncbi:hypothetical protein ILUMI_01435 [Ignelater luminosus]|uniref:VWFC domain-containing protein n=1 Tax=Ignelater luminosus TaxID=2038154 RepID=A0A8K0GM92_IGNLU|nr:hypothetical protein ILUMI_01435 [Ignelater luminosus]